MRVSVKRWRWFLPVGRNKTLDITLYSSKVLRWSTLAISCVILFGLLLTNLPLWALSGLALAVLMQLHLHWRHILKQEEPFDLLRLRWQDSDADILINDDLRSPGIIAQSWLLTRHKQPETLATLTSLRIISGVIFLQFKLADHSTYATLIVKDQLTEQDYRQLLLWLNMRDSALWQHTKHPN